MQIKTNIVSSHTADSKPVKQEVNGTVILPPLVFPALSITAFSLTTFDIIVNTKLSIILQDAGW